MELIRIECVHAQLGSEGMTMPLLQLLAAFAITNRSFPEVELNPCWLDTVSVKWSKCRV